MITPNKFISFNESILSKLRFILEANESNTITQLYLQTEKHFDNIDEFLYALDVLHILDKVEIDIQTGYYKKC